jgi:hypothetical protein
LKLCQECGLENDPVKAGFDMGTTMPLKNGKWSEKTYFDGEAGYAMCLTEKHVPEKYYDRGGNEIIYMDTFTSDKSGTFMKNLTLFLPMMSHSGKLKFVKRAVKSEIYRNDLIMNGIEDSFILGEDSYESFMPEIYMPELEDTVVEIIKKYITNVAAICRTLV